MLAGGVGGSIAPTATFQYKASGFLGMYIVQWEIKFSRKKYIIFANK